VSELRPATRMGIAETIVEVWEEGHFIAAVYPIDRGVKIVSEYFYYGVEGGIAAIDPAFPPALHVHIRDRVPKPEPPA
jgi:hypothetical protein